MPTAADHRAEADSLGRTLDDLADMRAALARDRDGHGVRSGTGHVIDWAIAAAVTHVDELGRLTTSLVEELRRRAALCDQYGADLQRYEDAHARWRAAIHRYRDTTGTGHAAPWPGPAPVPPAAPFPGAVPG